MRRQPNSPAEQRPDGPKVACTGRGPNDDQEQVHRGEHGGVLAKLPAPLVPTGAPLGEISGKGLELSLRSCGVNALEPLLEFVHLEPSVRRVIAQLDRQTLAVEVRNPDISGDLIGSALH
jgi:hypothetical protein